MLCKPTLRRLTFVKLHKKESFGGKEATYGIIRNDNVEEALQKLEPLAFKDLVIDLFIARGYEVEGRKLEGNIGIDVVAKKGQETLFIKLQSANEKEWLISEEVVGQVLENLNKAKNMIITNGRFEQSTIKKARKSNIELVNGTKLASLIREIIQEQKQAINKEKIIPVDEVTFKEDINNKVLVDNQDEK